jgi:hypothetical protein
VGAGKRVGGRRGGSRGRRGGRRGRKGKREGRRGKGRRGRRGEKRRKMGEEGKVNFSPHRTMVMRLIQVHSCTRLSTPTTASMKRISSSHSRLRKYERFSSR